MAAPLNPDEQARKDAARAALQKPSIPAAEQAIADAAVHQRADTEAAAVKAETSPLSGLELPEGYVRARVLRKGHERIYTGQIDGTNHDPEGKFTRYKFGDIIPLPGDVALAQEDNGLVEVQPAYRKMLGLPQEA